MPWIFLKEKSAFKNADTGGAWVSSTRRDLPIYLNSYHFKLSFSEYTT